MSARLSPRQRRTLALLAIGYLAFVGYTLLVLQQLLLALLPLGIAVWMLLFYLLWRLVVAVESMATSMERIADHRERE